MFHQINAPPSAKPPSGSRRKDARGRALAAEEGAAAAVKSLQTIQDEVERAIVQAVAAEDEAAATVRRLETIERQLERLL